MNNTKILKTPIQWMGGKAFMVNNVLPYIPYHKYYLEVFGGGGSILFGKKESEVEVFNDIDKSLFNLFYVIREKDLFDEFLRLCSLTLYSREDFNYCKKRYKQEPDIIKKAYMFYYLTKSSFGGFAGNSFGYSLYSKKQQISYYNNLDLLPKIHERLKFVLIENLNWKELMLKYNWDNDGFCYLDPPYLPLQRRAGEYENEMTGTEHVVLINFLLSKQWKGKIILSGYNNSIYKQLEDVGWIRKDFDVACHCVAKTSISGLKGKGMTFDKNQRRTESIWMNYDINEKNFIIDNKKENLQQHLF